MEALRLALFSTDTPEELRREMVLPFAAHMAMYHQVVVSEASLLAYAAAREDVVPDYTSQDIKDIVAGAIVAKQATQLTPNESEEVRGLSCRLHGIGESGSAKLLERIANRRYVSQDELMARDPQTYSLAMMRLCVNPMTEKERDQLGELECNLSKRCVGMKAEQDVAGAEKLRIDFMVPLCGLLQKPVFNGLLVASAVNHCFLRSREDNVQERLRRLYSEHIVPNARPDLLQGVPLEWKELPKDGAVVTLSQNQLVYRGGIFDTVTMPIKGIYTTDSLGSHPTVYLPDGSRAHLNDSLRIKS